VIESRLERDFTHAALRKPRAHVECGAGSSFGIATDYRLDCPGIETRWGENFHAFSDRPSGPPSLLYNGYRIFPGGKFRPGRAADHSRPSSVDVMEE
jgi:hypothetical protein